MILHIYIFKNSSDIIKQFFVILLNSLTKEMIHTKEFVSCFIVLGTFCTLIASEIGKTDKIPENSSNNEQNVVSWNLVSSMLEQLAKKKIHVCGMKLQLYAKKACYISQIIKETEQSSRFFELAKKLGIKK